MADSSHYYALILAGGGGTRLWPKSRKQTPKHLLALFGKKTLLRTTYDRIKDILPNDRILVITNKDHLAVAKEQLPEIAAENFISEPQAKNTALAMGVGAAVIAKRDPEAVIINVYADQAVKKPEKYAEAIEKALETAQSEDSVVAIAIKPEFAHTGLGYIKVDGNLEEAQDLHVFKGLGFKEKPDLETAKGFIDSGQYLWNAGFYSWKAQVLFDALKEFSPQIYEESMKVQQAVGTPQEQQVLSEVYEEAENIQIDYAVSEKVHNLLVVPGDFGWSDIGDWKVIYDTADKDEEGNVILNPDSAQILINTKNTLIEGDQRLIVGIGLENLVIVDTGDAILICNKDNTQDVKKAVEKLKEDKKDQYL